MLLLYLTYEELTLSSAESLILYMYMLYLTYEELTQYHLP